MSRAAAALLIADYAQQVAAEKDRVVATVRAGQKMSWPEVVATSRVYTPGDLARSLVDAALAGPACLLPAREIVVMDPFVGAGSILLAAFDALEELHAAEHRRGDPGALAPNEVAAHIVGRQLVGVDVDRAAVRVARAALRRRAGCPVRPRIAWLPPGLGTYALEAPHVLLGRRYTVVCTNPPYGGQRQLDPALWAEIRALDPRAGTDLAVAGVARSWDLVAQGGTLAVLTPASWLASRPALSLRRALFDEGCPRSVARLGQGVFAQAPLVFAATVVVDRLGRGPDSELQDDGPPPRRVPLSLLASLPTLPLLAAADPELLASAAYGPSLGQHFATSDGRWASDPRTTRYFWELPHLRGWARVSGGRGAVPWYAGTALRGRGERVPTAPLVEYGRVAGNGLAARLAPDGALAQVGVVRFVPRDGSDGHLRQREVLAIMNTSVGARWRSMLSTGLNFNPGYAAEIPLGNRIPTGGLNGLVDGLVALHRTVASWDMTLDDFQGVPDDEAVAIVVARVAELSGELEVALAAHLGIAPHAPILRSLRLPSDLGGDRLEEMVLRLVDVRWPAQRRAPLPLEGLITPSGVLSIADLGHRVCTLLDRVGHTMTDAEVSVRIPRAPVRHAKRFRGCPILWAAADDDGKAFALVNVLRLWPRGLAQLAQMGAGRRVSALDGWTPDWSEGVMQAMSAPVEVGLLVSPVLAPRTGPARVAC